MIMSEENQELEQQFIEIYGEDGQLVKCEIYDVVDFENKTYALLLPITEEQDDDAEVIVMEYVEEGEDAYFQNIDDDEEFRKVCAYIESLDDEEEE